MKITKKEIEKILGYEIVDFKITKRAYQGQKVVRLDIAVQPKQEAKQVTITIKPT